MKKDSGKGIPLGDHHLIDLDHPLPAFDTEGAKAYAAIERQARSRLLYALVGDRRIPRRERVASKLLRDPPPQCVRPLIDGTIEDAVGHPRWAAVLERPEGGSLAAQASMEPFTEDMLRRVVLPQAVQALEQLHARGVAHRSIRPSRLFWKDAKRTSLVLGECFSEPPAYSQPGIYEPVERAAAPRAGRGEGIAGSDVYSLGVTLVALALGRDDPGGGVKDLLDMRLARGTAGLLLASVRLSSDFKQALQGLLADDLARRWSLSDLRLWLKGAQPAAKNVSDRTLRPIVFAGQSFGNRRLLARTLGRVREGAEEFIRSPGFINWVQNGLNDPDAARRIRTIITGGESQASFGYGDVLAVQRILDPLTLLPVARQNVAVDGLGPALAEAYREDQHEHLSGLARLFQSGLAVEATESLADLIEDPDGLRRTIAYVQSVVGRAAPGFGLERALYELNPGLPCFSPLLGDSYALDARDVLLALNARASKLSQLVDRHIAAFFGAHAPEAANLLAALNGPANESARLMAELGLLAALQRGAGTPPLKALTAWFAGAFHKTTEKFHGAKHRASAERILNRLGESGDLSLFRSEVDLEAWIREDENGFQAARRVFQQNLALARSLLNPASPQDEEAIRTGHRGAIAVAYGALVLSVFLSLAAS